MYKHGLHTRKAHASRRALTALLQASRATMSELVCEEECSVTASLYERGGPYAEKS